MSNQLAKMNRKQRREYAKNINTYEKLKGFESEFIRIEREKAQKEIEFAKKHYLEIIMVMVAWTANCKLNLGKKRLPEFMQAILENIDCYNTGNLTPEDYDYIKEEVEKLGFKF